MSYEIGPIRPPSEARSLLVRVTRGCHWNKCKFCGLYKNCRFSVRSLPEIIKDIRNASMIYQNKYIESCFLQDSDAFVLNTDKLLQIVETIKYEFPEIKYITSYARADSILRKSVDEIKELKEAGLNHLYCGMESASDNVLELINKGVTSDQVTRAGIRAKEAGMILSEFILLGIGGKRYSIENALETAKSLNEIKPDYIRVHATAIKPDTPLGNMLEAGEFELQSEQEIVAEQKLLLQNLREINSYYVNEHMVNLLLEVRGNLSQDRAKMLNIIEEYLQLSEIDKKNFALGRRLNLYTVLNDMNNKELYKKVEMYLSDLEQRNDFDLDRVCNLLRSKMI